MLSNLPDELIRKIMTSLPMHHFILIVKSCKHINHMQLHRLLLGWGLEGICGKNDELSGRMRRKYIEMDRKRGPLYCMYDLIQQIAILIGDNCSWDSYDTNNHDFIYRLLCEVNKPWYLYTRGGAYDKERKRLYDNNIPVQYHKSIMQSLLLRALLL